MPDSRRHYGKYQQFLIIVIVTATLLIIILFESNTIRILSAGANKQAKKEATVLKHKPTFSLLTFLHRNVSLQSTKDESLWKQEKINFQSSNVKAIRHTHRNRNPNRRIYLKIQISKKTKYKTIGDVEQATAQYWTTKNAYQRNLARIVRSKQTQKSTEVLQVYTGKHEGEDMVPDYKKISSLTIKKLKKRKKKQVQEIRREERLAYRNTCRLNQCGDLYRLCSL